MNESTLDLSNVVHCDFVADDYVYLDWARITIWQETFVTRHVHIRFRNDGPKLDLSIYDMDRIVMAYLTLRGIASPPELETAARPKPERCDFMFCVREAASFRRTAALSVAALISD